MLWASEIHSVALGDGGWGLAYPNKISSADAGDHVGEFVQVCGTVSEEDHDPGVLDDLVFLNFDDNYPEQSFTAWGGSIALLREFRATGNSYEGAFVCVKGTIKNYEGIPQIKVSLGSSLRKDARLFSVYPLLGLVGGAAMAHRLVYPERWQQPDRSTHT